MNRPFSLKLRYVPAVGFLLVVLATEGFSQKINWGNAANDINSTSDGGVLTDATFTFAGALSSLSGTVNWGDGAVDPVQLVAGVADQQV